MLSITVTDQINLIAFWLVFARWVTIMFQLPLFDNTAVPPLLKVLTSLMISYAFFPLFSMKSLKTFSFSV